MPPERGNVDRVAGLDLGGPRRRQRLAEAREALEIGGVQFDHARRLPRHGAVERPDIEIVDLIGRKQREAPLPRGHASDIVRDVEMGGDDRAIAQPYPRRCVEACEQGQGIGLGEAGEHLRGLQRPGIDCGRPLLTDHALQIAQQFGEGAAPPFEVEALHVSDDEAAATLLANLEGEPLADPRPLRFTTGRRKLAWNRNCVAIGLSGGFLEPLESTSIHLIQAGISRLLAFFPDAGWGDAERDTYNDFTRTQYEQVRDFVILHYKANGRDEPLWHHAREMAVPESLTRRIELFRNRGRVFRREDELFGETSWIAVMLGQGITPQGWDPLADALDPGQLRQMLDRIRVTFRRTAEAMPAHADWLARHCPSRGTA